MTSEKDEGLEADLLALGAALDVPSPPPADVAAAVHARLRAGGGQGPAAAVRARLETAQAPPRRTRRRWVLVAAIAAVLIAITAATPQGRAAISRVLEYAGIELQLTDLPTATPTPTELPTAKTGATFPHRTPAVLGTPDRTLTSDNGRVLSMFWGDVTDGVRLDQFDGGLSPVFFKQLRHQPQPVRLATGEAWWIADPHPVGHIAREDGTRTPLRLATRTLIWQANGIGHRLEGAKNREDAVRIAESLR
ncbi:hypothetical protein [Nonomuraea longicatena]|uniref:DUF4367 domain-containing protein n=1 Tax=Nonomuraea longicatena TaxID=83682 RepID=A0ABN1QVF0_9ACTN